MHLANHFSFFNNISQNMYCRFSIFISLQLAWNAAAAPSKTPPPPKCRFSPLYTQEQILANPDPFASDLLYWEGKFHQNNVSYNSYNGVSYDGTLLDETTGLATAKHPFSAASKEVH
jgi:hypothetical protein